MKLIRTCFLFFLAFSVFIPSSFSNSAKVKIQSASGDVMVLRQNEAVTAEKETLLRAGDIIKTGENGQVDIAWADHWGYRLLGMTKCKLDSIKKKEALINMIDGNIILNVKKVPESGEIKVITPVAVAAVRGTQFWGRVQPEGEQAGTTFAVREGQVEIFVPKSKERFLLHQGDALTITPGAKIVKVRKALEEEMQAMAQADEIVV